MNSQGVQKRAELDRHWGRATVDRAVREGRLIVVARGWYALPDASSDVLRAIRLGGRLDCVSAAQHHGLWVPDGLGLHVQTRRTGPARRGAQAGRRGAGVTWHSVDRWRFSGPVAPVGDAVRQVIACHDPELALIVLESALNLGLIGWAEAEHLTRRASRRKAAVLAHLSEQAQSGGETRVRLFLELHGVHVRAQVSIPGVGRVDLLVGDRLVIECDSRQHHTGGKHYARDRRRDLELITLGYKPVRLTYHQIFFEWEATQQYLLRLVRSGRRRVRLVAA